MLIKFMKHGKGSAARAAAYVLDEKDHLNNVRADVEVLRGDAQTFVAACDSSQHKYKYTSAVIAFAPADNPTSSQIDEVLNAFERHAFAGLRESQYHFFAVLHQEDDGSKHIHVLVPRLDLETGKSLNIAPPNHHKYFDPLRNYLNYKNQWSSPDSVLNSATTREPQHVQKLNAQARKILDSNDFANLKKSQFTSVIDYFVTTLVKTQTASNRDDIVKQLIDIPQIKSIRESENFISVTLENGKTHRLRGDFYERKFETANFAANFAKATRNREDRKYAIASSILLEADCERLQQIRKSYNAQHHSVAAGATRNEKRANAVREDQQLVNANAKHRHEQVDSSNRATTAADVAAFYSSSDRRESDARADTASITERNRRDNHKSDADIQRGFDSEMRTSDTKRTILRETQSAQTDFRDDVNFRSVDDASRLLHELSNEFERNADYAATRRNETEQNADRSAARHFAFARDTQLKGQLDEQQQTRARAIESAEQAVESYFRSDTNKHRVERLFDTKQQVEREATQRARRASNEIERVRASYENCVPRFFKNGKFDASISAIAQTLDFVRNPRLGHCDAETSERVVEATCRQFIEENQEFGVGFGAERNLEDLFSKHFLACDSSYFTHFEQRPAMGSIRNFETRGRADAARREDARCERAHIERSIRETAARSCRVFAASIEPRQNLSSENKEKTTSYERAEPQKRRDDDSPSPF